MVFPHPSRDFTGINSFFIFNPPVVQNVYNINYIENAAKCKKMWDKFINC